jgi:uncharacterized protein (UPF0332 family)
MDGRAFLDSAQLLVLGRVEADWRSASGRAYYALFSEARAALRRWSFLPQRRDPIHAWVRLRFEYANDADLKQIGNWLDWLSQLRNEADYQLDQPGRFRDASESHIAIQISQQAIALLDQIESDPARRAAAITAITATIPP